MSVVKEGELYVIPCREWAAIHLDKDITYEYKSRRNALRAVNDPKRNTLTSLCYYTRSLFTRVCVLETILARIKKEALSYDFDVCGDFWDGSGSAECDCSAAGGCGESAAGDGSAGEGTTGADSGDDSTGGSTEGAVDVGDSEGSRE